MAKKIERKDSGKSGIIYLACPYSKGSPETRLARFNAVTLVAAHLIEARRIVFSPITMTHPIDLVLSPEGATLGSAFWTDFDEQFMQACVEIYVLMLPGWKESSGVIREIAYFQQRGIQPIYLNPAEYGVVPDLAQFATAF